MNALLNVIAAESYKVLRKRRLYILAALYWVVLPVLGLIVGRLLATNLRDSFANEGGSVDVLLQAIFSPFGLSTVALSLPAYASPTLYIVAVALLAALLIGDERSQQMWKTVLVVQPNRVAVLTGKVVVCMLALLALMAGAFISSIVFGAIGTTFLPTGFDGEWLRLAGTYLLQWAHLLAPVLLAFLLVFVVRSAVLGIVMVLFLPGLIEGVYTILNTLLQLQPLNRINAIFQTLRLRQAWEDAPRYFFTANLYAPARSPTSSMVTDFMAATNELEPGAATPEVFGGLLGMGLSLPHAAAVMAGYALVIGALLYWAFLRRDVD